MHGISEIHGAAAAGQALDVAFGREDEHVRGQHVVAQALHKLLTVGLRPVLERLADPFELLVQLVDMSLSFLVPPVSGDAVLGQPVHLPGTDLHFQRFALRPHDRRMKGAVHVVLGVGDVIVELPGDGLPQRVDDAEDGVAGRHVIHDHAQGQEVVKLFHRQFLAVHLLEDAVKMFGPTLDVSFDAYGPEPFAQNFHGLVDDGLALRQALFHAPLDVVIHGRIIILEGKILERALDLIDAKPVRQRRIDLQRFLGDALLLVAAQGAEAAHVVRAVSQLDEDDADVLGHDKKHLAQVFRLIILERLERQLAQFGDAVHEHFHGRSKTVFHLVGGHGRVFKHVVQQAGLQRWQIHAHVGEDGRDVNGMNDVRLAGGAHLIAVCLRGKHQRLAKLFEVVMRQVARRLAP